MLVCFKTKYTRFVQHISLTPSQAFTEYYSAEHSRLLRIWKEVVSFRRQFGDLRLSTERDLSRVASEVARTGRRAADACAVLVSPALLPAQAGTVQAAQAAAGEAGEVSGVFWGVVQDVFLWLWSLVRGRKCISTVGWLIGVNG